MLLGPKQLLDLALAQGRDIKELLPLLSKEQRAQLAIYAANQAEKDIVEQRLITEDLKREGRTQRKSGRIRYVGTIAPGILERHRKVAGYNVTNDPDFLPWLFKKEPTLKAPS